MNLRSARRSGRRALAAAALLGASLASPGVALATDAAPTPPATSGPLESAAEPSARAPWASLQLDWGHSCGVRQDSSLWCWGSGGFGMLGDGSSRTRLTPHRVDQSADWSSVAVGEYHSCATKSDGTLWCFGRNEQGQLGIGDRTRQRSTPAQVVPTTVDTRATVDAAGRNTCATRADASLWCWGSNHHGQLGTGDLSPANKPKKVDGPQDWASVSTGGDFATLTAHTCGIKVDHSLWCWGSNQEGELGIGAAGGDELRPVQVAAERDWASVSASTLTTCAVATDGTLWCWGDGSEGALGQGNRRSHPEPVQVGAGTDWATVSAGDEHTCATTTSNAAWCWGDGKDGELGTGDHGDRLRPAPVIGDLELAAVVAGPTNNTCGVDADGAGWCWGADNKSELGTGKALPTAVPTPIFDRNGRWTTTWSSLDEGA